jgi:dethiobiotin synthetase
MNYFVTAIDTDSGKTLVSAILCEAFQCDYWKPVQAGLPRDADVIIQLVSNHKTFIHPETYLLNTPVSPHAAAKIDGIEIRFENFILPITENKIVIEGAGGCLVPLNTKQFVIDLVSHFKCEVIVVADLYLGSINHTLLTIEALRKRDIPIKGIIFNGAENIESQNIILQHTKLKSLLHIYPEPLITKEIVKKYARKLKLKWNE